MQPFRTTRRIEFYDTDMAGIVHFSNFFRFMEAAEVEFLRSLGLSVRLDFDGQEIGFTRVAAACDYLRPARFPEVLDVAVFLDTIGRKSLSYVFEFSRQGELLARGRITCVCCRVLPDGSLESCEIPEGMRQLLEPYQIGNREPEGNPKSEIRNPK